MSEKAPLPHRVRQHHNGSGVEPEDPMLRFLNEVPVYNPDLERLRFVGLDRGRPVICRVTKDAILASADAADAPAGELLRIFARHRRLFEDIASMEYAAGARDEVYIERFHVEQPWLAPLRTMAAAHAA
jgi:hypothetical protein